MADLPPPPIYPPQGPYTVEMGMEACGCSADQIPALSLNCFGNEFTKNITEEDLKDSFKSLAEVTPAARRIRLTPVVKRNIRAYNAWIKHNYRLGLNPAMEQFHPAIHTSDMLDKAAHMKRFTSAKNNSKSVAEPEDFTKDIRWEDWNSTVSNYFRMIPGSDGVPLSYILREHDAPDLTPNPDFKDDYVKNAPLVGTSFVSDAREVHAAIRKLIMGNTEAEAIIKPHESECNGRLDWKALTRHYEGEGLYANDIAKAREIISNLYYIDEKPKHMWWTKFQTELDWAFATYTKRYSTNGRQYHPNEEKLRILLDKVRANYLSNVKAMIKVQTGVNVNYLYSHACLAFKTEVNAKYPSGVNNDNRTSRYIRQTQSRQRGKDGGGGGFLNNKIQQFNKFWKHDDAEMVKLKNGSKIKYHASFNFPDPIYNNFPENLKDRMRQERSSYNTRKRRKEGGDNRVIKELKRQMDDMHSVISQLTDKNSSNESHISELSVGTGYGGKAEKRAFKRRNDDDRE